MIESRCGCPRPDRLAQAPAFPGARWTLVSWRAKRPSLSVASSMCDPPQSKVDTSTVPDTYSFQPNLSFWGNCPGHTIQVSDQESCWTEADTSPVSRGIIIMLWLGKSLLMEGECCGMPESFQMAGSMTSQGLQFRDPAPKQDGPRGGSEVGILRQQQGS